jgi:hypothetical protein
MCRSNYGSSSKNISQGDILVSAFAMLLLVLVARIAFGFVGRVRGVKMLIRGLFSEFLDH